MVTAVAWKPIKKKQENLWFIKDVPSQGGVNYFMSH